VKVFQWETAEVLIAVDRIPGLHRHQTPLTILPDPSALEWPILLLARSQTGGLKVEVETAFDPVIEPDRAREVEERIREAIVKDISPQAAIWLSGTADLLEIVCQRKDTVSLSPDFKRAGP